MAHTLHSHTELTEGIHVSNNKPTSAKNTNLLFSSTSSMARENRMASKVVFIVSQCSVTLWENTKVRTTNDNNRHDYDNNDSLRLRPINQFDYLFVLHQQKKLP